MKKWINVVNNNDFLIPLHEYYNSENEVYDSALLEVEGIIYGGVVWNSESNDCSVEVEVKYLPKVYRALENLAKDLGGHLYVRKNEIFDSKRHLPAPKIEIKRCNQYFDIQNLDNIRWIGFREDNIEEILDELKWQKDKSGNLEQVLSENLNGLVVTHPYKGWTFIIGNDLPYLFVTDNEGTTDEALSNLCRSLQKLSKRFIEVQYYEYNEKSNITGYFKANNGKLIFGYWKSETETFSKGRIPKDIKKFHPTSAHEIASIWSIDPLDFIYIEEFLKENSFLLKSLNEIVH